MKTIQATRCPARLKAFTAILATICVFTVAANAQPRFLGKFTLPHEVHWGQATLPAGQYFIRMEPSGPAMVRSASGDKAVFLMPPAVTDSEQAGTFLTITTQGNKRTVRSLNLGGEGKSLTFAPLSKTEREVLAKARQIEAVPVVTAKK